MTWNDEAEKWIELARDGHDPNAADTDRVRRALVARGVIVAGSIAGSVATTAGAAASATTVKALVVQASAALLAAGSVATATTMFFDTAPSLAPAAARSSAAASAGSAAAPRSVAYGPLTTPEPSEAPGVSEGDTLAVTSSEPSHPQNLSRAGSTSARSVVGVPPAPPAARSGSAAADATSASTMSPALEREIAGLRSAQQALHRGETESAARALDKLEATSPEGAMLEERLATRTILACSSGNEPDALADFLARFPASVHRERVLAACTRKPAVGRFPETGSTGQGH